MMDGSAPLLFLSSIFTNQCFKSRTILSGHDGFVQSQNSGGIAAINTLTLTFFVESLPSLRLSWR
jgi:hypothetical protein